MTTSIIAQSTEQIKNFDPAERLEAVVLAAEARGLRKMRSYLIRKFGKAQGRRLYARRAARRATA